MDTSQCFPLYYYEKEDKSKAKQGDLFSQSADSQDTYTRKDGITDFIFKEAKAQYNTSRITKEDIFYYVYGFLHSPEYRLEFEADLKKSLPRIPLVDTFDDFWAFSQAGRKLADLHLNYENVPPAKDVIVKGAESDYFRVQKMKFPKKNQKDTIIFNSKIMIENIPLEAYEYVVNGKSAIEWIIDRYQIKIDKNSGITNDPNDWADEVGNPRYILDLLLSIIQLSLDTMEIVKGLPKVKFDTE